jgi:indole-3-glycerol phosphate synthase
MMLDQIVAAKKRELAQVRERVALSDLERRIAGRVAPLDFAAALRGPGVSIIAEVKKASPSRGLLCPDFDPVRLATTYAAGGAAAISVLTEANHFQGSLDYLAAIRSAPGLESTPLLRKDFLFDEYQLHEARAFGADAVLLIVATLDDTQLRAMLGLAAELGLQCLVEVHDAAEMERAVAGGARVIGINNRDLRTFDVDLGTTEHLRSLVPPGRVIVSESGVRGREDIERLDKWNVDAALIGEALVTAPDVAARLKDFVR